MLITPNLIITQCIHVLKHHAITHKHVQVLHVKHKFKNSRYTIQSGNELSAMEKREKHFT